MTKIQFLSKKPGPRITKLSKTFKLEMEQSQIFIGTSPITIKGWSLYINWILKSRNPRNPNLVRKNRGNFSSRTKLEVMR